MSVQDKFNQAVTNVANGKTAIANAITAKGVATATDASFSTMATNIAAIQTSNKLYGVNDEIAPQNMQYIPYRTIWQNTSFYNGSLNEYRPMFLDTTKQVLWFYSSGSINYVAKINTNTGLEINRFTDSATINFVIRDTINNRLLVLEGKKFHIVNEDTMTAISTYDFTSQLGSNIMIMFAANADFTTAYILNNGFPSKVFILNIGNGTLTDTTKTISTGSPLWFYHINGYLYYTDSSYVYKYDPVTITQTARTSAYLGQCVAYNPSDNMFYSNYSRTLSRYDLNCTKDNSYDINLNTTFAQSLANYEMIIYNNILLFQDPVYGFAAFNLTNSTIVRNNRTFSTVNNLKATTVWNTAVGLTEVYFAGNSSVGLCKIDLSYEAFKVLG